MKALAPPRIRRLVKAALLEDVGRKDRTTASLIPPGCSGKAWVTAQCPALVAGLFLVKEVYAVLDRSVCVTLLKRDGCRVRAGMRVARVEGPLKSILTGERVALNFLSHLSGVATLTRRFVDRVRRSRVAVMDTRKTLPLFRELDKYAVRCGGGVNQRMNLEEAVMVKDNHLAALRYDWMRLGRSLARVRRRQVTVEVDRLSQLAGAMSLSPDVILLDNMSVREVRRAVRVVRRSVKRILLEASGRITLRNIERYARTGVNRISVGALTHSAPHVDFSVELAEV